MAHRNLAMGPGEPAPRPAEAAPRMPARPSWGADTVPLPAVPGRRAAVLETPRTPQALADDFMQWLAAGLATGEMSVNTSHAPVHVSADGLVLVYPAVFQAYLRAPKAGPARPSLGGAAGKVADSHLLEKARTPETSGDLLVTPEREKALLKALCAQGWHVRGLLNSNLLHFHLQQFDKAPAFLRALVIRPPQHMVAGLPRPNPGLVRLF
jgi:hypothetical protein